MPLALDRIETWIFDLDNTLYPASCRLYVEVEQRMARFIMEAVSYTHLDVYKRQA